MPTKFYKRGLILKDPYCHIRNFYILSVDNVKFEQEASFNEAILSLIIACAYINEASFKEDSLLKTDANIFEMLTNFISQQDPDRVKYIKLINQFIPHQCVDKEYILNWMNIRYGAKEIA